MDQIQAQKIKAKFQNSQQKVGAPTAVIVVNDIRKGVLVLEQLSGLSAEPVIASPGIYKLYKGDNRILIFEDRKANIVVNIGSYAVIYSNSIKGEPIGIEVDGYRLCIPVDRSIPILFTQ